MLSLRQQRRNCRFNFCQNKEQEAPPPPPGDGITKMKASKRKKLENTLTKAHAMVDARQNVKTSENSANIPLRDKEQKAEEEPAGDDSTSVAAKTGSAVKKNKEKKRKRGNASDSAHVGEGEQEGALVEKNGNLNVASGEGPVTESTKKKKKKRRNDVNMKPEPDAETPPREEDDVGVEEGPETEGKEKKRKKTALEVEVEPAVDIPAGKSVKEDGHSEGTGITEVKVSKMGTEMPTGEGVGNGGSNISSKKKMKKKKGKVPGEDKKDGGGEEHAAQGQPSFTPTVEENGAVVAAEEVCGRDVSVIMVVVVWVSRSGR